MRRLLVCLTFLLCCGPLTAQTTIYLVRHAEKAAAPADDPPLTAVGKERAARLVEVMKTSGVSVVYTTPLARTRETAAPVAAALNAKLLETPVTREYAAETAARIKRDDAGTAVLVVGHSNTTPALAKALTGVDVPQIPDPEHDHLFIITIARDGKTTLVRAKY